MKQKQNFEIVNARVFKSTLHNFHIELSSKYSVVGVNFALLKEN